MTMINFNTLPPLSLYIHYPWCARKCPYCDFNSHSASQCDFPDDHQRDKAYIAALINDLHQELPNIWGRSIHSVFIGGGTPSLIHPEALHELLIQLTTLLSISPFAEITLEANPGTVDQARFSQYRQAGINRLSLGIQSFNDALLEAIGRIHDGKQACQAIEYAYSAGFENINLDMMYALPGQTLQQARQDIQQAIGFSTTHLSHYQLTLEANTLFARHPPVLPNDDLSYDMQRHCQELLASAAYQHYEISAYAKSGYTCQHNINYWQFGDYLGIGAGAHGKISNASTQTILRRWKIKHPRNYLATHHKTFTMGESSLSKDDIVFEFMLNATRLTQGFSKALFTEHTGLAPEQLNEGLNKALALQLVTVEPDFIKPTERGLRYLNELQSIWL